MKTRDIRVLSAWPFVWCGVLVLLSAQAQDRGVSGTVPAPATGPQKWAVVIGVGDYQDAGIGDLPNAVNDARAIKAMLVTMPDGFPAANVMLLADGEAPDRLPSRSNIIRYLTSRLNLAGPDDTILVYFAGHGTTEKGALYLLPNDAASTSIADTGYSFASLEKLLQDTPARKRILILDACHSGTGRANESMSAEAVNELEKASKGIVTLASCSGEEKSHEMPNTGHGAFTYFLLDALTGKADTNGDGVVSATEASLYTWDATRRWASEQGLKQTPLRREEVSGEILLAKSGGTLPAARTGMASAGENANAQDKATPYPKDDKFATPPSNVDINMFLGAWQGTKGWKRAQFLIANTQVGIDIDLVHAKDKRDFGYDIRDIRAVGPAIVFTAYDARFPSSSYKILMSQNSTNASILDVSVSFLDGGNHWTGGAGVGDFEFVKVE